MGKREKRKWRPLLSPFLIVRPPGISLSPRLGGLAARPKTRGVTVFTQFLSIALQGVSVRRYLFPWPWLACKQARN